MADLSVVVTGRNDNYDGNFDERLAVALSKNIAFLPNAEFIYVEWNPILSKDLSCTLLKKIFGRRVKYYVVHPKFHSIYCTIDDFLEYPAKNVGIRKSTREFVVCVNSDVIFAPDTVDALNGPLKKNVLYRTDRIDIKLDYLNVEFPIPKSNVLEINKGITNAAGDFTLTDKESWVRRTGYCEEFPAQRLHKDAYMVWLFKDIDNFPVETVGNITHWRHNSSWSNGFKRPKIGNENWDYRTCGYGKNKDTWGLSHAQEVVRDGITWLV